MSHTRASAKRTVQVSELPDGAIHVAPMYGSRYRAVQDVVGHFREHSAPGGYVGIAPAGDGVAVQLHAADGRIEAWRVIRVVR